MPDLSNLPYRPLVIHEGLAFLSGQLGFVEPGKLVAGGIEEQTGQIVRNIERTLNEHELGLANLLKMTVWITRAEDFGAFNRAYAAALSGVPLPARSTVVSALAVPGALIEIEAVAAAT